MINDQARALAIVGALLASASGSAGFVGGRMSVPAPPAEVRFVYLPAPAPLALEAAPVEPVAPPAAEPTPTPPIEQAAVAPPVEAAPLAPPRPTIDAKPKDKPKALPKPERESLAKKPRTPAPKKSLPSCAVVQREYNAMTMTQRWAAYRSATPEQIAHGKRCLGF